MTGLRLPARPRASIKVRAALAAGLVLGLAAGLTVASWTDAERVGATFTASSFDLQSSLQGAAFTNSTSVTGNVTGLYPGSLAYLSLKVKTAAVSTAGTVSLSAAANSTGLDAVMRYRIIRNAPTCNAAAYSGSPTFVVGGAGPTYQQANAALAATPGLSLTANAGSEIDYCIELGMPATGVSQGTYAGASGTVTWNIIGTSS
jgi:predicted ribosomally synthesized peptide with SipW-like signal peptide